MLMIQDTLHKAIADSGMSIQGLSKATGIDRMSLSRFIRGNTTLRLEAAETLLEYFGYEVKPINRKRNK